MKSSEYVNWYEKWRTEQQQRWLKQKRWLLFFCFLAVFNELIHSFVEFKIIYLNLLLIFTFIVKKKKMRRVFLQWTNVCCSFPSLFSIWTYSLIGLPLNQLQKQKSNGGNFLNWILLMENKNRRLLSMIDYDDDGNYKSIILFRRFALDYSCLFRSKLWEYIIFC